MFPDAPANFTARVLPTESGHGYPSSPLPVLEYVNIAERVTAPAPYGPAPYGLRQGLPTATPPPKPAAIVLRTAIAKGGALRGSSIEQP
ncbi:MAG: hypothetical protein Q6K80_10635 [Thermostichus sp. DG_1_6_bins_120]